MQEQFKGRENLMKCCISDCGNVHVNVIFVFFFCCRADTDNLMADCNVTATSCRVENLAAGEYDVLIIAVARTEGSSARSTPSLPARFRVRASDTNFIIIGGVAGSVGVVILIAVGIFVGAFFLCFYSHR